MKTTKFYRLMAVPLLVAVMGCAEVAKVGTEIGYQQGLITKEMKEGIVKSAEQAEAASRPMTAEEEYFLGRAVGAEILSRYPLYRNERLTRYVNEIGNVVALSSDRPVTYSGYHFAILDTDEANAFACPSGTIFVTRGMLRRTQNEDELAAVLAHEAGHVNHRDGVNSIQKSRWAQVIATLGTEAARTLSGKDLAKLTDLFAGSVSDVVKTIIVNGYSRDQELTADQSALVFLHRAGYDPRALTSYLGRLAKEQTGGASAGFFSTHPGMDKRLAAAQTYLDRQNWAPVDRTARDRRFKMYF
ncbi:MAG TPA: M48 family metalloprotease [Syntrophales bacterium]|nr:M48 family metalloprotease [Syntrophales bacterium]